MCFLFFFFKQKSAYEMRISDWSSDVCSSDLVPLLAGFNSGELRSQRVFLPKPPASAAEYETAITRRYGDLAPEFLRLYPASDIEESMLATLRDAIYGWATERMIRKQSEAGMPAYLYLFDQDRKSTRLTSSH